MKIFPLLVIGISLSVFVWGSRSAPAALDDVFFSGPRNLCPADRLGLQRRNRETGSRVL